MHEVNRRHFLMSSVALPTVLGATASRTEEPQRHRPCRRHRLRRPRQQPTSTPGPKLPNVEMAALFDVDESVARASGCQTIEKPQEAAGHLPRHPQGARRQEHRRRLHRHAQPLAHAADHLGLPGRQGRLRREAVLAQRVRVAARSSRPRASTTAWCSMGSQSRSSPALQEAVQKMRDGDHRRRLHGARAVLQVRATPSARRPCEAVPPGVDYDLWTGPAPCARSPRTASTTTGTGSGTTATATSATRASTRSRRAQVRSRRC